MGRNQERMKTLPRPRILTITAFLVMILFSWANEVFDLPHVLFSAPETPINWRESIFETAFLLISGIIFFRMASLYEESIKKHLSGLHTICSHCHSVRDQDRWVRLEEWLRQKSDTILSHGLCWKCLKVHHPEIYDRKLREGLIPAESDPADRAGGGERDKTHG